MVTGEMVVKPILQNSQKSLKTKPQNISALRMDNYIQGLYMGWPRFITKSKLLFRFPSN
jgi:hypothetical protein